jgi:hypothetical protein
MRPLALALSLLGWSCGAPDPRFTVVTIAAEVRFTGTQVVIRNPSTTPWSNVELDINDGFLYRFPKLDAADSATIGVMQFAKPDGTRFNPIQRKAQRMTVKVKLPDGSSGMYFGEWP